MHWGQVMKQGRKISAKRNGGIDRGGFTLIELLIVVAIIAILAAIAVPNFLEAQVRSKVSRIKADLRALATAQESYYVEWNSYTFRDPGDGPGYYEDGFVQLTTPVAYIATIPQDPFGGYDDVGVQRWPMFEMGAGHAGRKESAGTPRNPREAGMPSTTWMIRSSGPDKFDDTHVNSYPWKENRMPNSDSGVLTILGYIYNPTNGTKSSGDIYRVGGAKPNGKPWNVYWSSVL